MLWNNTFSIPFRKRKKLSNLKVATLIHAFNFKSVHLKNTYLSKERFKCHKMGPPFWCLLLVWKWVSIFGFVSSHKRAARLLSAAIKLGCEFIRVRPLWVKQKVTLSGIWFSPAGRRGSYIPFKGRVFARRDSEAPSAILCHIAQSAKPFYIPGAFSGACTRIATQKCFPRTFPSRICRKSLNASTWLLNL
jgi:hypothetical protein